MRLQALFLALLLFFGMARYSSAAPAVGGRGGPYIQFHVSPLTKFDSAVGGNPIIVGGMGFGFISKKFRIGGAGGGGFLFNPTENVSFGLGYGGVVGDYSITKWLTGRLLIGGGGYSLVKILSETISQRLIEKVSSGGFVLFYPSVHVDIKIHSWMKLSGGIGYFLPNVTRLSSVTVSLALTIGRT